MTPMFIPGQAEGAIPNGSRIRKRNSEDGDGHKDGDEGYVMASHFIGDDKTTALINAVTGTDVDHVYFIKWDGFAYPVGTIDRKVEAIEQ